MTTSPRDPTNHTNEVAAAALRLMRRHGELRLADLLRKVAATVPTSEATLRRVLKWLRDTHQAPLDYDARTRMWVLDDRDYRLPLLDPTADDVVAVAFARALLSPIGGAELDKRIGLLLAELHARTKLDDDDDPIARQSFLATSSATMPLDAGVVSCLARALDREVVRITYSSPWLAEPVTKRHVIEPWQLRVHDGNLYVRGWLRSKRVATTFRVALIEHAVVTGEAPTGVRPPSHEIWGPHGPGQGVDVDRPDTATIRVRGPMARYVASTRWHPEQQDRWDPDAQLLERCFAYESCRATARRLLDLGDALEHVEPASLRDELMGHVRALAKLGARAGNRAR